MDHLISRYLTGELTDLETGRLRSWRKAAPENEERFRTLVRAWELSGPESARGRTRPPGVLATVVDEAERRRRVPRLRGGGRAGWWAAAAATVLFAGSALIAWRVTDRPALSAAEINTGVGETSTVTLSDGSFVRIGEESRLSIVPRAGVREVRLEGRAYFAVAPDPEHPFRVLTRAGEATALGTRFEVRVGHDDLRLTVVDGRVALAVGGDRVEVSAGEVSHARRGEPPSVIKVDDVQATLDWARGLLVFQATPLPQVAHELGRHFGVETVLTSPALADRKVTAWFGDERLEVVFTTVCRVTQTKCSVRRDTVTLSP